MIILNRKEIEARLCIPEVLQSIEQGFIAYSRGETVIPPIASLHFESPPGDCHIKYGYSQKGKYYVIKIASGFYENPNHGLPSNNGLMLLFDKSTGKPVCTLLDEGYLTDIRTAAAGYIAAKSLAPKTISCVGIVGTGAQAFYQLKFLAYMTQCRQAMIWGRDLKKAESLINHPDFVDWNIVMANDLDHLAACCNLIVTTTSSAQPLLYAHQIHPGTHITAVGADDVGKQELSEDIYLKADRVIVDSKIQCKSIGDTSYAIDKGFIKMENLFELGEILIDPTLGRTSDDLITVCDLTGIAIQDLQIAESVFHRSSLRKSPNNGFN